MIFIWGIGFYFVSCTSGKLKEKGLITIGTVKEINRSGNKGSSYSVEYNYIVNEKLYEGKGGISSLSPALRRALIGKHFPVIYLPENETESYILITAFDFSLFGKEYPDSLKWIEKNRE